MAEECRNIWLSSTEREALLLLLGTIEQATEHVRTDPSALAPAANVSLQAIAQSCMRIRKMIEQIESWAFMCPASETARSKN